MSPGLSDHSGLARGHRGFTLIEMVVVIIVLGIIAGLGALILRGGFNSYFAERDISAADGQAQTALARMTRELRTVRTASTADLPVMTSTSMTFVDFAGDTIAYTYDAVPQTITRSENGGTAQTLADHVSAASFSYWQSDAQTAATGPGNVYYITIQMTVTEGISSLTYRVTVHPRDFS